VHHTGFAVPIGEDEISLEGWVGLDHTLSIRLSLPVTERMVGKDPRIYRLLRGQRIELPITGTIEHPVVKDEAVVEGVQRLIRTAVRDHLDGQDLRNLLRRAIK